MNINIRHKRRFLSFCVKLLARCIHIAVDGDNGQLGLTLEALIG